MSDKILLEHTVKMENRRKMSVTGVLQVTEYDDTHVILKTDYGSLIIQGRDLSAGEISSRNNTLTLTGSIENLQYKTLKDKSRGLISRLLR